MSYDVSPAVLVDVTTAAFQPAIGLLTVGDSDRVLEARQKDFSLRAVGADEDAGRTAHLELLDETGVVRMVWGELDRGECSISCRDEIVGSHRGSAGRFREVAENGQSRVQSAE